MNRIQKLFQKKKDNILSVFITAGFPKIDSLPKILIALEKAGVDMVEIGIPFSDPTADGEAIQYSNNVSISNGMTVKILFEQLNDIRTQVSIPLVLMGYLNPPLQFGFDRFLDKAEECGIDGIILPDLPIGEFLEEYQQKFLQRGLSNIFLITPQTSEDRIREIDSVSDGFIYVVSTNTITGKKVDFETAQKDYFSNIKKLSLHNPALIGFGIRDRDTFNMACKYVNGAIIGSAFVQHIEKYPNEIDAVVLNFVNQIK